MQWKESEYLYKKNASTKITTEADNDTKNRYNIKNAVWVLDGT